MESQGTANRVQVTWELVRDEFELEPRGTMEIEGKGAMPTWYLVGRKAA